MCSLALSFPSSMYRPYLAKDDDDYKRSLVFEHLPEAPYSEYYRSPDNRYRYDRDLLEHIFRDFGADGGVVELFRMGGVWRKGATRPLKVLFLTSHHCKNVLSAFRYFRYDFPRHMWSRQLRVRPSMSRTELADYHASKNKAYNNTGVINPIPVASLSSPIPVSSNDISLRSEVSTSPIGNTSINIMHTSPALSTSSNKNTSSTPLAKPISPIKLQRVASGDYAVNRKARSLSPKPKLCTCSCSCNLSRPVGHSSRTSQKSPSYIRSTAVSPSLLNRRRKRNATERADANSMTKRIANLASPGSGGLNNSPQVDSVT